MFADMSVVTILLSLSGGIGKLTHCGAIFISTSSLISMKMNIHLKMGSHKARKHDHIPKERPIFRSLREEEKENCETFHLGWNSILEESDKKLER